MQEQNNALNLASTPNVRGAQRTSIDTSQQPSIDPRTYNETKGVQHTTQPSTIGMKEQTDNKVRATELSVNQQTLVNRLSTDRGHLDLKKDWNGISPHGPSHQGPRVLLIIHQEVCEPC